MRFPHLVLVSVSVCAGLIFTGCSSTNVMNSPAGSGAAPTVVATGDQVNGVAPNRKQEVQFSEAMDPSTINAQTFQIADSSGNRATGTVSYDPDFNTATFLPNPALQSSATYTATITTAAASSGGVHLATAFSYTFATRASSDTSPIKVVSVDPPAGATGVSATTPITITFDEAPDTSTLIPANFAVSGPGGAIAFKIGTNVTTTQVVLTPTAPLPSGDITVTVSNVADLAGVKMAAPFTWSFSTSSSGGGSTTTQYRASLGAFSPNTGTGQVTVDTAGNFMIQLQKGTANTMYTAQFCPMIPFTQQGPNCFAIGDLTTDASGNGSLTAKFPKSGPWAGDFDLVKGPANPSTLLPDYETIYGPNYVSTLQPFSTVDGGILSGQANNDPQAPLKSGTVTYLTSPAPNGSFQFTLTGATPNSTWQSVEGNLFTGGSNNYQLENGQHQAYFTADSQGNLTFTVLPSGSGGDIFSADPNVSQQGYLGGFLVP